VALQRSESPCWHSVLVRLQPWKRADWLGEYLCSLCDSIVTVKLVKRKLSPEERRAMVLRREKGARHDDKDSK
jgi:hypothetical protein